MAKTLGKDPALRLSSVFPSDVLQPSQYVTSFSSQAIALPSNARETPVAVSKQQVAALFMVKPQMCNASKYVGQPTALP